MRRREEKRISTCEKKRKDERVGGDLEDEMAPDRLQLGAACFASVKGQNKITKSKKKKKNVGREKNLTGTLRHCAADAARNKKQQHQ